MCANAGKDVRRQHRAIPIRVIFRVPREPHHLPSVDCVACDSPSPRKNDTAGEAKAGAGGGGVGDSAIVILFPVIAIVSNTQICSDDVCGTSERTDENARTISSKNTVRVAARETTQTNSEIIEREANLQRKSERIVTGKPCTRQRGVAIGSPQDEKHETSPVKKKVLEDVLAG